MSWLARFFYFLFVAVLLKAVLSLFFPGTRSRPSGSARPRPAEPRRQGTQMVRDPQCGMYLEPSLAIQQKAQGGVLYFCSEACRDQHLGLVGGTQTQRSSVP